METLLIIFDCIAVAGLMCWVIQNEDRGNGPVTGLFRYRQARQRTIDTGQAKPPRQQPRRRHWPTTRR